MQVWLHVLNQRVVDILSLINESVYVSFFVVHLIFIGGNIKVPAGHLESQQDIIGAEQNLCFVKVEWAQHLI